MYESVFGSVDSAPQASPGADAAFGPSGQATGQGLASIFHPATGFGLAFWLSVGGTVALVLIYRSLPG